MLDVKPARPVNRTPPIRNDLPGQATPAMGGLLGGAYNPLNSRSGGLFDQYMRNQFAQRFAPPVMPGGVQNMGGFYGFRGPQMGAVGNPFLRQTMPQTQQMMQMPQTQPAMFGGNY